MEKIDRGISTLTESVLDALISEWRGDETKVHFFVLICFWVETAGWQ